MTEETAVPLTEAKILQYGLQLTPLTDDEIERYSDRMKEETFRVYYGSNPAVIKHMWDDLLMTEIPEAQLDPGCEDINKFLMSHQFLKRYPLDREMPAMFHLCRDTIRSWLWYMLYKIAALKAQKIVWPKEWNQNGGEKSS